MAALITAGESKTPSLLLRSRLNTVASPIAQPVKIAYAATPGIDFAFHLFPDLRPGAALMRRRIVRIVELVRVEGARFLGLAWCWKKGETPPMASILAARMAASTARQSRCTPGA
jgi:hypothetical protein